MQHRDPSERGILDGTLQFNEFNNYWLNVHLFYEKDFLSLKHVPKGNINYINTKKKTQYGVIQCITVLINIETAYTLSKYASQQKQVDDFPLL